MIVKCLHGYFIFKETKVGQISDFISWSGLSLTPKEDYYTFQDLAQAPEYSIQGKNILTSIATKTFEGKPWEVFEANNLVYDFSRGVLVPIVSIATIVSLSIAGNRMISPGMILPGSLTQSGKRVKSYGAFFSRDTYRWLYSEVEYV